MAIGAVLYSLLQLVMIGAFEPANIASGWARPLGTDPSDYGAWYTLALAVGVGWLAKLLVVDAVISPAGAGVVYLGTTARLSYALGEEREMPSALASTNHNGVPVVSILVAAVVGTLALGPFKSWAALVSVVTGATAIMYAFAPVSLAALHRVDDGRPRSYRVPVPALVLPAAFCCANLIIYWGGFEATWKLAVAMVVGLALFSIGALRARTNAWRTLRNASWMLPWFIGQVVLGYVGRYGNGSQSLLPAWIDIGVVLAFSLVIFYVAVRMSLDSAGAAMEVAKDATQIDYERA
jgi:amino acid transporter